jgi:Tfp pilus assembly protein PilO
MNELISKFAGLRWSAVAVIGLFAGFIYWAGAFDHGDRFKEQVATGNSRIAEAQKRLDDTKKELANAEEFRKKVSEQEEDFKRLTEALPREVSATELIGLVSRQAADSKVQLKNSTPSPGTEKTEFYEKAKITFAVKGAFSDVLTFVSRMTGVRRILTFEKVEIRKDVGSDPEKPQVTMTGVLVAYRYIPENERAGAAGAKKMGATK